LLGSSDEKKRNEQIMKERKPKFLGGEFTEVLEPTAKVIVFIHDWWMGFLSLPIIVVYQI